MIDPSGFGVAAARQIATGVSVDQPAMNPPPSTRSPA